MPFLSTLKGSVQAVFRREALDRELDDELQSYLELLIDEKIGQGVEPAEARRRALMELGGAEQVKTRVRRERHGAAADALMQDVRFTFRILMKSPGFAMVVVLTLAIGIGANAALFSTIKALLLSDLPYSDPDRLVASTKTYEGRNAGPVSRLDYLDFRQLSRSFEGLGAIGFPGRFNMTGNERAEPVTGAYVSWNLFSILGVPPVRGRWFVEDEESRGGANVVLISHDLWHRRFGGDDRAVGRPLHLNGMTYEVVGVMPPGFSILYDADLWILIDRDCPVDLERDSHSIWAVGRLKDGFSLEQAQNDIDGVARILEQEYPETNVDKGLRLYDLRDYMVAHVRPSLNLLIATTGLVLLIACGNVAGLLLARGQQRVPEMAMRSALGASRWRLVRQLLTESLTLTMLAGVVGIAVAYLFHGLLLRLLPPGDPGVPVPAIDGGVLVFAVLISIATGLLVGVVPALKATSRDLRNAIGSSARVSEGIRSTRLRTGLVVVQVAMSVILLIGCGLLIRSMVQLSTVDLGFEPDGLLAGTVGILEEDYPSPRERAAFFDALGQEIEALPGVVTAATVSKLPIASRGTDWPIWHADQARPEPRDSEMALARFVTPRFFKTLGIPLLRGRDIAETDTRESVPVVVISEAVAQGLFPERDPIGKMVKLGWLDYPFEVVGVVGNARINGIRSNIDWAMYMSLGQFEFTNQWLVVRSDGDPNLLAEPIRKVLQAKNNNAVLGDLSTMTAVVDDDLSGLRVVVVALGILSGVALLLTAVGIYGVLAYHVSQRANEFGIRVALGSTSSELVGLVFTKGLRMVGVGLVLGLVGGIMGSRIIRGLLYQTAAVEPVAYAGAAVFLGAVAMVACLVPAWRASRIDPVDALRRE